MAHSPDGSPLLVPSCPVRGWAKHVLSPRQEPFLAGAISTPQEDESMNKVLLLPKAAEHEDYVRPYIERSLDKFLRQSQPMFFSAYNQKTIIVVTERRDDGSIWQLCALGQDDLEKLEPYAKENAAFQQVMKMPQRKFASEPVISPVAPQVPTAADGQHRHGHN